jgi:F-type H+-transporting ATPase subunit delta
MINGSIGRRYAKAFLEIAQDGKKAEDYLDELENFGQILETSPDIQFLMSDPSFEGSERKKALGALASPLKLSVPTQNFIKLLIDRDRMPYFREILRSYREQADELLGRVRVQVKVEEKLADSLAGQLQKKLEQVTKKKVILEVVPQKGILGGIVIKIKDLVFDGSVKSALNRLKERMMEVAVS